MITVMTNQEEGFYSCLGKIFGSRTVESVTHDRFYDDDEKVWYIYYGEERNADAYVSVKNSTIKNVYAPKPENLLPILEKLLPIIKKSVVPQIYKKAFEDAGYVIEAEQRSKNFITVMGG